MTCFDFSHDFLLFICFRNCINIDVVVVVVIVSYHIFYVAILYHKYIYCQTNKHINLIPFSETTNFSYFPQYFYFIAEIKIHPGSVSTDDDHLNFIGGEWRAFDGWWVYE